ncbi:MAG: leucine-rich repeat domain-containing protein, partial [Clostridia bacterium]|nr:leucine-rich repeat domain-containing protein [Clostridia bacterium]
NIYVDGALSKKIYVNGSEYWINEEDMPLDYESCCGYFLDSNLSRTADSYIYMGNGDVNLYTKTASDPNNFLFIYNETTGTYDIKAVNTSISGRIVLPKEYDNVQTSLYIGTFDSELNVSDGSFPYCTEITSITLQHGLTTISDCSFAYCSGLTGNLVIPDCVTTIGSGAFGMCAGISGSLAIPNSVTTIGDYSFAGCTGFNGNLTIGNNVTTIGGYAFMGCNGFTGDLVIPDSVTSIGRTAFSGCSGFDGELVIGAGLTTIEWQTFQHCSGFTGDLIIPDNITYVDSYAFYGCSGLTCNLNIPSGVTSFGYDAFAGCSGFTGSLTIPSSVTVIGYGAFRDCSGFEGHLIIPTSVTHIGERAFEGCEGIETVFIPSSVTVMGADPSFTEDHISGTVFYGCSNDLVIYTYIANEASVPDGWGEKWNYKSETETFTTKYGYSIIQYKDEVGLAVTVFAPQNGLNDNFFNEFEIEAVKTKGFNISFSNEYEQFAILNEEKEYVALLKENEKIA